MNGATIGARDLLREPVPSEDVAETASTRGARAEAEIERWEVDGRAGSGAANAWADVLAATHVAFEVEFGDRMPDRFHGTVSRHQLGELSLVDCASTPWIGHSSTAVIGEPAGEIVGLCWVLYGTERVGVHDPLTVMPGGAITWDGTRSTDVEIVEPWAKRTLILPRARVLAHCPQLEDLGTVQLQAQRGTVRLLASYLRAFIEELPTLDRPAIDIVGATVMELACSAIQPALPSSRTARRTALRAAVRRFIRTNLQDPLLDPQTVARAHSMSVRTLHALFEEEDVSVAALIRQERLSSAMTDLRSPSGGSVTEVAFRWGFHDSAHFSRAFRKQFGLSPREAREARRCDQDA